MEKKSMELKLAGLALENVSDGALEERFQALLADVTAINADALEYVGGQDGYRVSKITLEVEIRHRPSIGGDPPSTVVVSGAELKRPKRVKSAQPVYARDGAFFVEAQPAEQLEAFDKSQGRGGVIARMKPAQEGV